VFLRSYHGAYLSATSEGKVFCSLPRQEGADGPPVPHFAETWDIEFDRYGACSLRSFYRRYISAPTSSVCMSADQDFPGTAGRETFFPLVDDRLHTLGLISCDGLYVYADSQSRLVGSPTLPSLSAPATESPSVKADVAGSVEFYRIMSEGCRAFLEQNDQDGDILSSSFEFYQHLGSGAKDVATTKEVAEEKVDMNGTFELYKHLSDGASKEAAAKSSHKEETEKCKARMDPSLVNFHLPNEEEKWLLEVAPSREAQQAQMAQEVYQKTQHLRMIYSIHAASERKV